MPDSEGLPGTAKVAAYFDGLYGALVGSATQRLVVGSVLGQDLARLLGYARAEDLRHLADVAGIGREATVLDLCCGSGAAAKWTWENTGARTAGVDCSMTALLTGSVDSRGCALVGGDVDALPFRDGSFDAVVSVDGFSYRFWLLAAESHRVLKPGGRLAMLVSLPTVDITDFLTYLAEAGFSGSFSEDLTVSAREVLGALRSEYQRRRAAHTAEVGERVHVALVEELERLLRGFDTGRYVRVLMVGQRG